MDYKEIVGDTHLVLVNEVLQVVAPCNTASPFGSSIENLFDTELKVILGHDKKAKSYRVEIEDKDGVVWQPVANNSSDRRIIRATRIYTHIVGIGGPAWNVMRIPASATSFHLVIHVCQRKISTWGVRVAELVVEC